MATGFFHIVEDALSLPQATGFFHIGLHLSAHCQGLFTQIDRCTQQWLQLGMYTMKVILLESHEAFANKMCDEK